MNPLTYTDLQLLKVSGDELIKLGDFCTKMFLNHEYLIINNLNSLIKKF